MAMEKGNTLTVKEFAENELKNIDDEINLLTFKVFDRLEKQRVLETILGDIKNELDKLAKMQSLLADEREKLEKLVKGE